MKHSHVRLLSLLVCGAAALWTAPASAEGWGMPNLNPFASKGKPPTSASVGSASDSRWSLVPKMPSFGSSKPKSKSGPSTWSKMTSGTKSFFDKTADAINPWDDDQPVERSVTGSNTMFSGASPKKKETEKKSFLPSWAWGTEEEDNRPKTVNDFLAQPTPEF